MFDAFNINIGGGNMHRNSGNSKGFDLKAKTYNSAGGRAVSDEKKSANAFAKAIGNYTFSDEAFAFFLYCQGPVVIHRALKVFEALLKVLAREFDNDRIDNDQTINMAVEAKRYLDYSKSYGRYPK